MYEGTFWRGGSIRTSVISGVEHALWDIKGKSLGMPVNHLVGGPMREQVKVYTHFGLRSGLAKNYAASAVGAVEMGFRAIKTDSFQPKNFSMDTVAMRVATDRIRKEREAIGEDVDILIKCHGPMNASTAIRLAKVLEPYDIFWFEEPVPVESDHALKQVQDKVSVPICVGERIHTRWEFVPILENELADFIMPYVTWPGGISEMKKTAI